MTEKYSLRDGEFEMDQSLKPNSRETFNASQFVNSPDFVSPKFSTLFYLKSKIEIVFFNQGHFFSSNLVEKDSIEPPKM